MAQARKPRQGRSATDALMASLRYFLTPVAWKQAHAAAPGRRRGTRWTVQPLVLTLLALTWCAGESIEERFEIAKAFVAAGRGKRRRPGATVPGFTKAAARLPMAVFRRLASALRPRLLRLLSAWTAEGGYHVFGVDGTRVPTPRSAELQARLGAAAKRKDEAKAAASIWITAMVHLRSGLLWSWRLGLSNASERGHAEALVPTLPARSVVVADAGFISYTLMAVMELWGGSWLLRVGSGVLLYTDRARRQPLARFREGWVYYWPGWARRLDGPPLRLRLLQVRRRRSKQGVWLLTDLSAARLSRATAARWYRWRWESEGMFRTYKRTLGKVKLASRRVKTVHREAETALLAVQLLLAQGVRALTPLRRRSVSSPASSDAATPMVSPRQVLREIRRELAQAGRRRRPALVRRLRQAVRRRRTEGAKTRVPWPARRAHRHPKPPQLRRLPKQWKAQLIRLNAPFTR